MSLASLLALSVVAVAGCSGNDANRPSDAGEGADSGPDPDGGLPPGPLVWSQPENLSNSTEVSTIWCNWGNSIAITSAGSIHVVWREFHQEQQGVEFARVVHRRRPSTVWDPVQDLTGIEAGIGHPKITASGDHVYVVWHIFDPLGDDTLHLRISGDDGRPSTFSADREIVSDAARGPFNLLGPLSATPSIAAWGEWVHVVWSDERFVALCGAQIAEIYLLSSSDRGAGWSQIQQATTTDCRSSWTPSVSVWQSNVHVAWTDERDKTTDCGLGQGVCLEELYYRRLPDDGRSTGEPEVRMTEDPAGQEVESWAPSIAAVDNVVHLVWFDRSGDDDFEVYYLRSLDQGQTWTGPARQLSRHGPGCAAARPTVAAEGPNVHVVWLEHCGDVSSTVMHTWSDDTGGPFSSPSDILSGQAVFAIQPSVAVHDGTVHVVWTDLGEIYHAESR